MNTHGKLKYVSVVREGLSLGWPCEKIIEEVYNKDAVTFCGKIPVISTIFREINKQKAGKSNLPKVIHHSNYEKDPKRNKAIQKAMYRVISTLETSGSMRVTEIISNTYGQSSYIREAIRRLEEENFIAKSDDNNYYSKIWSSK